MLCCIAACLLVHPACNATTLNYKDKTYLHGRTVVDWTGTSLAFTKSRSWSRSLICTRYRIGLKVRISEAQAIWLIGVEHEQAHTHTRRLCLVSSSLDFWWPIIGKDTPHITRLNIKNHSGVGGREVWLLFFFFFFIFFSTDNLLLSPIVERRRRWSWKKPDRKRDKTQLSHRIQFV